MAREGIPFVGGAVFLSLACWLASDWIAPLTYATAAFGVLTAFVVFFFRDPERTPPPVPGAILSAGDGKVVSLNPLKEMAVVEVGGTRHEVHRKEIEPLEERRALLGKAAQPCSKREGGGCDCGAHRGTSGADT